MSILNHRSHRMKLALAGGMMVFFFLLGVGFGRLTRSGGQAGAQSMTEVKAAPFVNSADGIAIPEGSVLRSRIAVQQVLVKNSPQIVQLPASVEADPTRTVNILTPVAGKVVKLNVQLGDHVTRDQPLAVIDSADLAQAYADEDKARSALLHAARTLDRVRNVHQAGGGPLKDLEQAESDFAQAQAEFSRAEARLREIGVPPESQRKSRLLTLTSPITGSVTSLGIASGAFVNDLNGALMTISNLDSIWVTAMVPESDIALIKKNQTVDVSFPAYPGMVLRGSVSFVSDVVDSDTRRTKVRTTFPNPDGKLKPNMFASTRFNVPQKSAVFVPNSALLMDNDSTTVLVEVAPWTFTRRQVQPGYGEGETTRIDQGLDPEDRVIVKGGVLLHD